MKKVLLLRLLLGKSAPRQFLGWASYEENSDVDFKILDPLLLLSTDLFTQFCRFPTQTYYEVNT
jgi:hypothetical protein